MNNKKITTYNTIRIQHRKGRYIMNLQSMENWFLYYALIDIKNVDNLKCTVK